MQKKKTSRNHKYFMLYTKCVDPKCEKFKKKM